MRNCHLRRVNAATLSQRGGEKPFWTTFKPGVDRTHLPAKQMLNKHEERQSKGVNHHFRTASTRCVGEMTTKLESEDEKQQAICFFPWSYPAPQPTPDAENLPNGNIWLLYEYGTLNNDTSKNRVSPVSSFWISLANTDPKWWHEEKVPCRVSVLTFCLL